MGTYCKYEIPLERDMGGHDYTKEQLGKLRTVVEEGNWSACTTDMDDWVIFEGHHPYSFSVAAWLQEEGIDFPVTVNVYYEEREPDEVVEVNDEAVPAV